ncbi:MAG: hypothetical protein MZU97_07800 [Bacillus subtilis]|nr:hypothetical protein [Bacillus subtilis]
MKELPGLFGNNQLCQALAGGLLPAVPECILRGRIHQDDLSLAVDGDNGIGGHLDEGPVVCLGLSEESRPAPSRWWSPCFGPLARACTEATTRYTLPMYCAALPSQLRGFRALRGQPRQSPRRAAAAR